MNRRRDYRIRVKARAIKMMGGKCERCGYDDARALRLHHVQACATWTQRTAKTGNVIDRKPSRSHTRSRQGPVPLVCQLFLRRTGRFNERQHRASKDATRR